MDCTMYLGIKEDLGLRNNINEKTLGCVLKEIGSHFNWKKTPLTKSNTENIDKVSEIVQNIHDHDDNEHSVEEVAYALIKEIATSCDSLTEFYEKPTKELLSVVKFYNQNTTKGTD